MLTYEKDLGKIPDKEIARKIGCSVGTVEYRRHRLGFVKVKKTIWTKQMDADIQIYSTASVAKKYKIHPNTVNRRKKKLGIIIPQEREKFIWAPEKFIWTPERDAELGTVTDSELADKFGVSTSIVFARRQALGIEELDGRWDQVRNMNDWD